MTKILSAFAARFLPGRLVFGMLFLVAITSGVSGQGLAFGDRPADWDKPQAPCEKAPALREPLNVEYPEQSLKAREEGVAIIATYIDARGDVTYGIVERSSGFAALDSVALLAVQHGLFKSCWRDGGPQGARLTVPVEFRLPGTEDWTVPKNEGAIREDVQNLKSAKQAVEDKMEELQEEIRRLRAKQDSLKNAKK